MARRLILSFFALAMFLIIGTITATWALLATAPGRAFVFDLAEPRIGAALGADVEIEDGGGRWPRDARLARVTIVQDGEVKIEARDIHLQWRPLALIRQRIIVDAASIGAVDLIAPLASDAPPKPKEDAEFSLQLPDLPHIELRAFRLGSLSVSDAFLPEAADLSAEAQFIHTSDEKALILRTYSEGGADFADLTIEVGEDDTVRGRGLLSSNDGLIARIVGLAEPLALDLVASGTIDDWAGRIDAEGGEYGTFGFDITGERRRDGYRLSLDGSAAPGAAIPAEAALYIGESAALVADIDFERGLIILDLKALEADAGSAAGSFRLQHRSGDPRAADIALAIEPGAVPALDGLPEAFSEPWRFEASARKRSLRIGAAPRWDGEARVAGAPGDADISNFVLGSDGALAADIVARLAAGVFTDDGVAPLAAKGARLSAKLTRTADGALSAENIDARAGDGALTLNGAARLAGETVDANLDLRAAPALIAAYVADAKFDAPVRARATAKGALSDIRIETTVETPAGLLGETRVVPSTLKATAAGAPPALSGAANLSAPTANVTAEARYAYRADGSGEISLLSVRAPGLSLDGNARLAPNGAAVARLVLDAAEDFVAPLIGAVSGDAALEARREADGAVKADLTSETLRIGENALEGLSFTAEGPAEAVALRLRLERAMAGVEIVGAAIDGAADLTQEEPLLTLTRLGAIVSDEALRLQQPAEVRLGRPVRVRNFDLAINETGRLRIEAEGAPERLYASLIGDTVLIPFISASADFDIQIDTDAETPASGEVRLTGRNTDYPQGTLVGSLFWDAAEIALDLALESDDATRAIGRASAPLKLTRGDVIAVEPGGTMNVAVDFKGPVEPLLSLAPPVPHLVEGNVSLKGTIAGPLEKPEIDLTFGAEDGRYESVEIGAVINRLKADGSIRGAPDDLVLAVQATGAGARGGAADAVRGSATIELNEAPSLKANVALKDAALVSSSDLVAIASGGLDIEGPLEAPRIAGRIRVNRLDAQIPKTIGTSLVEVEVVRTDIEDAAELENMRRDRGGPLDIAVIADQAVYVRGRGLDTEWSADVQVGGTTVAPTLSGELIIREGSLTFAGRRFDITQGEVAFAAIAGLDPRLDITAQYEAEDAVTAIIRITGPASGPQIELSSIPVKPDEDVMAYVLFGKPAREVSEGEALQIAYALAQLAAVGPLGGSGFGDKLRRSLGLDTFSVSAGSELAESSLTVGKYVADGVFLSATQDLAGQNAAVELEIELTDRISLETQLRQSGGQRASLNYKRDF